MSHWSIVVHASAHNELAIVCESVYQQRPVSLDEIVLREARLENLERLARFLKLRLPMHKRHDRHAYHRAVVRVVGRALAQAARD